MPDTPGTEGPTPARGTEGPLLTALLPAFAVELQWTLELEGLPALARQVPGLRLVDRCGCTDSYCATMYTVGKPWRGPRTTVHLKSAASGMLLVHLALGEIVEVEVLDRDDVRTALDRVWPSGRTWASRCGLPC